MNKQIIEFVAMNRIAISYDNTMAFQFRTDRPYPWLQKICFFVLRKLRAFYYAEKVTIERHVIDSTTFMERLFKQREEMAKSFNIIPSKLLIGADDYAEMMHEVATTQMFSFNAQFLFNKEIIGLTVEVIPWMRGCLVMPK